MAKRLDLDLVTFEVFTAHILPCLRLHDKLQLPRLNRHWKRYIEHIAQHVTSFWHHIALRFVVQIVTTTHARLVTFIRPLVLPIPSFEAVDEVHHIFLDASRRVCVGTRISRCYDDTTSVRIELPPFRELSSSSSSLGIMQFVRTVFVLIDGGPLVGSPLSAAHVGPSSPTTSYGDGLPTTHPCDDVRHEGGRFQRIDTALLHDEMQHIHLCDDVWLQTTTTLVSQRIRACGGIKSLFFNSMLTTEPAAALVHFPPLFGAMWMHHAPTLRILYLHHDCHHLSQAVVQELQTDTFLRALLEAAPQETIHRSRLQRLSYLPTCVRTASFWFIQREVASEWTMGTSNLFRALCPNNIRFTPESPHRLETLQHALHCWSSSLSSWSIARQLQVTFDRDATALLELLQLDSTPGSYNWRTVYLFRPVTFFAPSAMMLEFMVEFVRRCLSNLPELQFVRLSFELLNQQELGFNEDLDEEAQAELVEFMKHPREGEPEQAVMDAPAVAAAAAAAAEDALVQEPSQSRAIKACRKRLWNSQQVQQENTIEHVFLRRVASMLRDVAPTMERAQPLEVHIHQTVRKKASSKWFTHQGRVIAFYQDLEMWMQLHPAFDAHAPFPTLRFANNNLLVLRNQEDHHTVNSFECI